MPGRTTALALTACFALAAVPSTAAAARIIPAIGADLSTAPCTFDYSGASITFSLDGDYFSDAPLTVATANGGQVNTVFGQSTTNFVDGRGGPLSFGPNLNYAAVDTATSIRFSNGGNLIGLRANVGNDDFYGFACFTNNVLNSIGLENTVGTATTGVPEPTT